MSMTSNSTSDPTEKKGAQNNPLCKLISFNFNQAVKQAGKVKGTWTVL